MNFQDSIFNGLENFFKVSGRMSRSAFWWFALFCVMVDVGIGLLIILASGSLQDAEGFLTFITAVTGLYIVFVPGCRRLHDVNKSATNLIWYFIPFIGWPYLIYLFCKPSDPEPNIFGSPT